MTYTHNTHDIHTQHDIARQDIQDITWISRLSLLSSLLFLFVPIFFIFSLLNGRMMDPPDHAIGGTHPKIVALGSGDPPQTPSVGGGYCGGWTKSVRPGSHPLVQRR